MSFGVDQAYKSADLTWLHLSKERMQELDDSLYELESKKEKTVRFAAVFFVLSLAGIYFMKRSYDYSLKKTCLAPLLSAAVISGRLFAMKREISMKTSLLTNFVNAAHQAHDIASAHIIDALQKHYFSQHIPTPIQQMRTNLQDKTTVQVIEAYYQEFFNSDSPIFEKNNNQKWREALIKERSKIDELKKLTGRSSAFYQATMAAHALGHSQNLVASSGENADLIFSQVKFRV